MNGEPQFKDLPPSVIQAMREEHDRFRAELRTHGPQVVPLSSMRERLKAARERAEAEAAANLPDGVTDKSDPV